MNRIRSVEVILRDALKARNRSMAVTSQGNDPPDARPNTIHPSSAPPNSNPVIQAPARSSQGRRIRGSPGDQGCVQQRDRDGVGYKARGSMSSSAVRPCPPPESFSLTPRIPADATTCRISGTGSVFSPAQYPSQAAGHEVSFDNLGSVSRCVCWALSWYCR